ncbi:MAG: hypothetical protein K1X79_12585 [Oligoflexia bacterium]|nr:hypothetical protein [Oligoflexia bacterium]
MFELPAHLTVPDALLSADMPSAAGEIGSNPEPASPSPSAEAEEPSEHDSSGDALELNTAASEADSLRQYGADWAGMYGLEPEGGPESDPHGGQDPQQYKFDKSLGHVHAFTAVGMGLGVASAAFEYGTSSLAIMSQLAGDVWEGISGATGLLSAALSHRFLWGQAFSEESGVSAESHTTPGYSSGVGHSMMPATICAAMGFGLYETHSLGALGALTATAAAFGFVHWLRFRDFGR